MNLALRVPADGAVYLTSGWFSISVPNLIVIGVTLALFVLALVLPFPKDRHDARDDS